MDRLTLEPNMVRLPTPGKGTSSPEIRWRQGGLGPLCEWIAAGGGGL